MESAQHEWRDEQNRTLGSEQKLNWQLLDSHNCSSNKGTKGTSVLLADGWQCEVTRPFPCPHSFHGVTSVCTHTHLLTHGCTNLCFTSPWVHTESWSGTHNHLRWCETLFLSLLMQYVGLHKSLLVHFVKRSHVFFPKLCGLGYTACLLVRLHFPLPLPQMKWTS